MDGALLVKRLAPLLQTNLRAEPCEQLYASDASPGGAGGCVAPAPGSHDLAEEKGEHVRLNWKGEEPPSNVHDGRAAAAPFALELELGHDVFLPFLRRQAHRSLGTLEPDQPPQAGQT